MSKAKKPMVLDQIAWRLSGIRRALKLKEITEEIEADILCIDDAIHCLKEYIEPWMCNECGLVIKIPLDPQNMRKCQGHKCKGNKMFPYAYLEQERMDIQLRILVPSMQYYATQSNGAVAARALQEVEKWKDALNKKIDLLKPKSSG